MLPDIKFKISCDLKIKIIHFCWNF